MNNLIVLDVETGGYDENLNPITQVALQVVEPIKFKTIHYFDTFVKPYNNLTIDTDALKSTMVTMKDINSGVDVNLLLKELISAVKIANKSGRDSTKPILVGHNIGFDKKMLKYLFAYKNKDLYDYFDEESFCTMRMTKLLEAGSLKSDDVSRYTLTSCCERQGIPLKNAHGAPADVEATKQLFIVLTNRLRNAPTTDTEEPLIANSTKRKTAKQRDSFYFEI